MASMLSSLRGRIALILVVLAVSGWQLYRNSIKLGLDLQGGMHLALEVDDPDGSLTQEAKIDAIDRPADWCSMVRASVSRTSRSGAPEATSSSARICAASRSRSNSGEASLSIPEE